MLGPVVTEDDVKKAKIRYAIALKQSGRRYSRQGQCNRCGQCCMHEGADGGPCEHLIKEGDTYTCLIHDDPNKPKKCGLFPELPPILFKTCGYYFIDNWNNNKVLRYMEVE